MGILADILIIAILIINIIIGYKKGLVNVIFNIFAFLIAIIITFIAYKPISEIIIKNTSIYDNIKSTIINNSNKDEKEKENENENEESLQKYIQDATEEVKTNTTELIAENIAKKSIEIITGIIVFIVTRILLILLKFVTEAVANLPIIKQLNEIGGFGYGLAKGLIIIYIILTIMFLVISINGNKKIVDTLNASYITKFLYDNNIIVNYCFLGKNLL